MDAFQAKCGNVILPGTIRHLVKRVIFKPEVNNETKKESTTSVIRNKYTVQFKEQVLARADRDRHSHSSR